MSEIEQDVTQPKSRSFSEGQVTAIIGYISGELASRSGAWDGDAPSWFPEPPEWLDILDEAIEATTVDPINLHEETDPMVWAETFVDLVHSDPSIARDVGTMVGWFANAFQRGEWNSEAYKLAVEETRERIFADELERERMEHPLYALVILNG